MSASTPQAKPKTSLLAPRRWLLGALLALAAVLVTPIADARTSAPSAYTLRQTYMSALRFVRVDMGYPITEKDKEAGYILFEYESAESGHQKTPGAIEVFKSKSGVTVVVQLSKMPRYHEAVMIKRLMRKLRNDYGEPPKRPKKPKKPPTKKPDDGKKKPEAPKKKSN